MKKINIAIDGYSSCGKSTLAKSLAARLGYIYIDSGAMYRAITYHALRRGLIKDGIPDVNGIINELDQLDVDFERIGDKLQVLLNGENIEKQIRTMEVSSVVSIISSIHEVRVFLHRQQQKLTKRKGVVMDGRDIGTAVMPDAALKIFMTADPEVRTRRRFLELQERGINASLSTIKENLRQRDYLDTTRKENPLIQAPDALILDNTDLDQEEQLNLVMEWAEERLAN